MLIQRPECNLSTIDASKQFVGIPTPDNSINKMQQQQQQQQQQHIKRLLSTAATATGIVGDVDALSSLTSVNQKTERNLWRLEEVKEVLQIMQSINALDMLNDKTVKSEKVFRNIEEMMHRKGFRKKSHSQIWTKWKFLKSTYMTSRRNGVLPKMIPYEIYQILHTMLGGDVTVTNAASSNGTSLDGDNSNAEEVKTTENVTTEQNNNKFGMAHPIFGFRLGMVKAEPADTGYETTANNSAISEADSNEDTAAFLQNYSPNDSTENFMHHRPTKIKEERVTDSPVEASPSPPPSPSTIMPHVVSMERPLLIPRNTESMSITAIPRTITPAIEEPTTSLVDRPLPPLRIAPFAKERNMTEALQHLNHSPPPLLACTNDDEKETAIIRKMLRKTDTTNSALSADLISSLQPRPSVLRLPKDVTLQLRTPEPETNTPRLKQVPMRQTTYSLRPERLIPDLSDGYPVNSLQNSNPKTLTTSYPDIEKPTTSQMALQTRSKQKMATQLKQKKRRLEIPKWQDFQDSPQLAKISRPTPLQQRKETTTDYESSFNTPPSPTFGRSSPEEPTTSKNATKKPTTQKDSPLMEEILNGLATSLREAQLKMIDNFFDHQMEIARKEHEFQMKQDTMILQAFKEQTNRLMAAAKKFFGSNMNDTEAASEQDSTMKFSEPLKTKKEKNKNQTKKKSHSDLSSKKNMERNTNQSNEQIVNGNNSYEPESEHSNVNYPTMDPMQLMANDLIENSRKY